MVLDNERSRTMNAVIIYYSRSGNIEKVARQLHADLEYDLIKIEPEKDYGNYVMSCFRVLKENASKTAPRFKTPVPDLTGYDAILLGFPIWVQDVPSIVQNFVSQCDMDGKTVIPFATYNKNGIDYAMNTLNRIFSRSEIKLPYDSGAKVKGDYQSWISELKKLLYTG